MNFFLGIVMLLPFSSSAQTHTMTVDMEMLAGHEWFTPAFAEAQLNFGDAYATLVAPNAESIVLKAQNALDHTMDQILEHTRRSPEAHVLNSIAADGAVTFARASYKENFRSAPELDSPEYFNAEEAMLISLYQRYSNDEAGHSDRRNFVVQFLAPAFKENSGRAIHFPEQE